MLLVLEWSGCIFGLIGAGLLAMNNRFSGWGFVAFLLSNALWIAYGLVMSSPGLVVMQVGFTATSLLGIYRWLVCHSRERGPMRIEP